MRVSEGKQQKKKRTYKCMGPSANSLISFRLSGSFQWFLAFQQVYKTRQVIKNKKDDKLYTIILIRLK